MTTEDTLENCTDCGRPRVWDDLTSTSSATTPRLVCPWCCSRRIDRLEADLKTFQGNYSVLMYDKLADAFYRDTGVWPPGRSRPAAMGNCLESDEERYATWSTWLTESGEDLRVDLGDRVTLLAEVDRLKALLDMASILRCKKRR